MTEVTLKVMPKPESERTLMLRRARRRHRQPGDDRSARLALRRLGGGASAEFGVPAPRPARWRALARRGGRSPCCGSRASRHRLRTAPTRSARRWRHSARWRSCRTTASAAVWSAIRDVQPFAAGGALGRMAGMADRLSAGLGRRARPGAGARDRRRRDLRLGRRPDLGGVAAEAGRAGGPGAPARRGGRRPRDAGPGARSRSGANVDVFHPQAGGVAALGERVRHSFDPKIILNRGRMLRAAAT